MRSSPRTRRRDSDALREACLGLLVQLGHPVHHAILVGIVRANTRLTPSRRQVLFILSKLLAEGRVERTRAGVYRATPAVNREER